MHRCNNSTVYKLVMLGSKVAELLSLRQDEPPSRLLTLIKTWKAEEFAAGDCLKPNMIEFSILIFEMNPWAQILQD